MNFSSFIAWTKTLAQLHNLAARVALLEKEFKAIMDALTHLEASVSALTKAIADQKARIDALIAAGNGATQAELESLASTIDADVAAINATAQPPAPTA